MDEANDAALRELFEAAKAVQANAHVPYSRFAVGAAVRSASGRIYAGCNVENAALPQGWCAEASAVSAVTVTKALSVGLSAVIRARHASVTCTGESVSVR